MILPFSPHCPEVTTVRLFPHVYMVLQANVHQDYLPQSTSVYAKWSDICNGILGLIWNANEQMIVSIYKVKWITMQCNSIRVTLKNTWCWQKASEILFRASSEGGSTTDQSRKIYLQQTEAYECTWVFLRKRDLHSDITIINKDISTTV